ncbi:MAG: phage tail protein [Burkholderiales bacterium]
MNLRIVRSSALALFVSAFSGSATAACGSEPFIGSICTIAFNFCPRGYLEANGQLIPINQNTPLFSLLGTTYGGDGRTTFALPDLRGRNMIGAGQGPGLAAYPQGELGGNENVMMTQAQMPAHTHAAQVNATSANGNVDTPSGALPARMPRGKLYSNGAANAQMGANSVTVISSGGGQPVPVRDPYLAVMVCIATAGIFPSRP